MATTPSKQRRKPTARPCTLPDCTTQSRTEYFHEVDSLRQSIVDCVSGEHSKCSLELGCPEYPSNPDSRGPAPEIPGGGNLALNKADRDALQAMGVIGDQATCKNIRGARRFRQDDVDDLEKLTWAKECPELLMEQASMTRFLIRSLNVDAVNNVKVSVEADGMDRTIEEQEDELVFLTSSPNATGCIPVVAGWKRDRLISLYRNKNVYLDISNKLRKHGFEKTTEQCRSKIKNLKTSYKKAEDNNQRSGRDRVTQLAA
ncbi:hypothetical protein Bbelb_292200 [Branchiostoma belcheri]|nr:hypothetical protein Bbelb_292200 [Branchiostoma belcheri]